MDDLVQILMVVIGFGDAGRPTLDEMAQSPKANVRRAAARAMGEARDGSAATSLIRLIDDPGLVRATAGEAAARWPRPS